MVDKLPAAPALFRRRASGIEAFGLSMACSRSNPVDCGVPNCLAAGMNLEPRRSSEEHLPIRVPKNVTCPQSGDLLYVIPRHICPTVNNFDWALIVAEEKILAVERVDARGREGPLLRQ